MGHVRPQTPDMNSRTAILAAVGEQGFVLRRQAAGAGMTRVGSRRMLTEEPATVVCLVRGLLERLS